MQPQHISTTLSNWFGSSSLTAYSVEKLRFSAGSPNFFAVEADQLILARGSAKFNLLRCWALSSPLVHYPN